MDASTAKVLQEHFRRTGRSLLQYVGDAMPWTDDGDSATLDRLQQLVHEEAAALAAFGRYLRRQRIPVASLGSFPEAFTSLNFIALDRLLPLLVEHHGYDVNDLKAALEQVTDPEARQQMQQLLAVKQRHLEALSELNKMHTPNAVRV
jgi:hypothetical protein